MFGRLRQTGVITAVLLLFAMGLAACGGSSTSSGPVNLVFWSFNQQVADQAAKFNASHPNIHVTGLQRPSGANQYYPALFAAIKAGNAPDVAIVEYQYNGNALANSALLDISQYGAKDLQSQFAPEAWGQVQFGNQIVGLPQDTGNFGLFYNKKTFEKAHISSPPATWAEFAADAVKIHALGPKYFISAFGPQNTGWQQALYWQAGAVLFSVDSASQSWHININGDKAKEVARFWDNLISNNLVDTTDADFSNAWNAKLDDGTIASWPSAVWGQGVISGSAKNQSGNWAVAPIPQWQAGQHATSQWGGSEDAVIKGTKHPREAYEFLKWYLTNPDSLHIGVEQIGWFPSNLAARQFPAVTGPSAFYGGQVVDSIFTDSSYSFDPNFRFPPNLTTLNADWGNDVSAAITAHQSLTTALDKLQTEVVNDLKGQGINVVSGP
jgi:multiple sugar transport system substrate-binding protein